MSSGPPQRPALPHMATARDPQAGHVQHHASTAVRHADSWIDLSSQPSSSSASSVHDEVITHGLRVQRSAPLVSRRRAAANRRLVSLDVPDTATAGSSSQEEYDESESESDRVMTSSVEDQPSRAQSPAFAPQGAFTPQPNAFSHPPSSTTRPAQQSALHYFESAYGTTARDEIERPAFASSLPTTTDHDAALRASLTTLLSCAAAARALPKAKSGRAAEHPPQMPPLETRSEAQTFRMIPAAEMERMRQDSGSPPLRRRSSGSPSRSISSHDGEKNKRKAMRSMQKDGRATKRLRAVSVDEAISPTLLTWVVSAGVFVIVGALSFSAGYAMGRETGRAEASMSASTVVGECGRQSRGGLGIRRKLLGSAAQVVSA